MAKVKYIQLPSEKRVIVTSDIHGNLSYLRGLLKKLAFGSGDVLILLGDLVEKGPESLETLHYVMELSQHHEVYGVLGNCDAWYLELDSPDEGIHRWVRNYLLHTRPGHHPGLIAQMCALLSLPIHEGMDMTVIREELGRHFAAEFDFLRSLPHILHAGDYVFVHGGLPPEGVDWEEADGFACMKCDGYAHRAGPFERWVVVGHTPVQLYREDITSAAPIVDGEKRLISIDGGCFLKDDGQLNALILENGRISYDWYDPFPLCRALDAQEASSHSRYIPWGNNRVEVLREEGEFSRVRQLSSGYEMDVPSDFLYYLRGELVVNDCTDYRPAVAPGDVLSLVRQTSRGAWIKKDGVSGWYHGRLEAL